MGTLRCCDCVDPRRKAAPPWHSGPGGCDCLTLELSVPQGLPSQACLWVGSLMQLPPKYFSQELYVLCGFKEVKLKIGEIQF